MTLLLLAACAGKPAGDTPPYRSDDSARSDDSERDDTAPPDDSDTDPPDDADGDGYTSDEGDCDEADPAIHPGAEEVPGDGIDSNCDGVDTPRSVALADLAVGAWTGPHLGGAGTTVLGVPDATGDGGPDILVGAPIRSYDPDFGGYSMTFLLAGDTRGGGALEDVATSYWSYDGVDEDDQGPEGLGSSLAFAADLDGDGIGDVLVGNRSLSQDELSAGVLLGYAGGRPGFHLASEALFEIRGLDGYGFLGKDVAGGDDLDGDGTPDLAVAQGDHSLIFLGPLSGGYYDLDADATLDGPILQLDAATRDIDGDGHPDLVVGTGARGLAGPFGRDLPQSELFTVVSDDVVGSTSLGDVDGDGRVDLACGMADPPSGVGTAAVFAGPLTGSLAWDSATSQLTAAGPDTTLGYGLTIAADLDADGDTEIVVGEPNASGSIGVVFVWADPWEGVVTPDSADLAIDGVSGDCAGWALSGRDLDGDAHGEVLVGGPGPGRDDGTAWLLLGADLTAELSR